MLGGGGISCLLGIAETMHECEQDIWEEVFRTFELCLHAPGCATPLRDMSRETPAATPASVRRMHAGRAQTAHWEPIEEAVLACITDTVLASKVRPTVYSSTCNAWLQRVAALSVVPNHVHSPTTENVHQSKRS